MLQIQCVMGLRFVISVLWSVIVVLLVSRCILGGSLVDLKVNLHFD